MNEKLMTLEEFQVEIDRLHDWAFWGCGNHGCRIDPPKGMGTNSTCQCTPHEFSETLLHLASEASKHGKYARW
jgi:hypothetical protein